MTRTPNVDAVAEALRQCTFAELREIAEELRDPLCALPKCENMPKYSSNRETIMEVQPLQIADVLARWAQETTDGLPAETDATA